MIIALLSNSCTSCRKTETMLRESGVNYEKREFFKERLTRDELKTLLDSAGLKSSDVISTRSRSYKERGLATRQLSDD